MAEQDQERSHAATPHKLREAQKRGQVAKSMEVNFTAVLAVVVCACFAVGPSIARQELRIARGTLNEISRTDWTGDNIVRWLTHTLSAGIQALAPLLLAVVCIVIVSNVAQTGPVFTFDPLSPDFSKLNPATGLKRLFSLRLLYDAVRSLLKLAVLSAVAWIAVDHLVPGLLDLNYIDSHVHAGIVLGDVGSLLFKLLLASLVIALIDLLYTRWDYAKKMRMSHRDLTDEHKQREGDPRIRKRLRQLRNEFMKQLKAVGKLPQADVLITNPTHIAIALSYRHGEMPAPKLLAKGTGQLAAKMRRMARRHNIPVVENPPLARELFKRTDFDSYIPEDLYPKVAKILVWVYAMRNRRSSGAAGASTGSVRQAT